MGTFFWLTQYCDWLFSNVFPDITVRFKGVFDWWFQIYQVLKTVHFAETEIQCPIKHKIPQNSRFQIHPCENDVSSCKIRRSVLSPSPVLGNKNWTDSITIPARANSPRFQSFANKNEQTRISPKSAKPSACCWSRKLGRPCKPARPAVFEIW